MSESALRDLNILPAMERKNDTCSKGAFPKPCNGNLSGNVEEHQKKNSHINGGETENAKLEVAIPEVEYIESENLNDLEDADSTLKMLRPGLDSKDWILVVEALNNVRRLSIFHKETMSHMLGDVIPLVVKSLKNPRSAVCKTALMTASDLFSTYNDQMVDLLDPLLLQLLLKASQDKKFVCEAAERALEAMTAWVSPLLLLPKLQPYLKNRNPRIRAKASMCFCRSVPRMGVEGSKAYGIDKLIQLAAPQLNDKLPESREAARSVLLELQTVYEKANGLSSMVSEEPESESWEHFCHSKLTALSAQAVLRVTNVAREGLLIGS